MGPTSLQVAKRSTFASDQLMGGQPMRAVAKERALVAAAKGGGREEGATKRSVKRLKLCLVRCSTGSDRTAGCRPHLEPRPGRRAPNSHDQLFYAREMTQNKTQGFTPIVNKHRVLG